MSSSPRSISPSGETSQNRINTRPIHTTAAKPPNLKLLPTLVLVFLSYLSMSFLTKLFRPFTTMSNAPAQPMTVPAGAQTATVAAGCFWGVEHMYRREYKGKGLYDARVGYIGGDIENPGYRAVCSGRTGRESIRSVCNVTRAEANALGRCRGIASSLGPRESHISQPVGILL